MNNRGKYQSGKLVQRRRRFFILRIVIIFIFIITLISGASFWSHSEKLIIRDISIENNTFTKTTEIEQIVGAHLEGNYFLGFARDNFALFPRGKIDSTLREKYSSIESVKIRLKNLHSIKIIISEYEPIATWCDRAEKERCYFVNSQAKIFLEEPLVHTYNLITLRDSVEGRPIGNTYESKDFLEGIVLFNDLLESADLNITNVSTEDGETFILKTGSGLELFIDKSDPIKTVFENLLTVIDQEAIHKEQFRNIEYIDLRFGNKVIYKLKEWDNS